MDNKTLAGIDHIGDLRAFVRVADACNFTLAAERLGLTRSAVGKCVARLEDWACACCTGARAASA